MHRFMIFIKKALRVLRIPVGKCWLFEFVLRWELLIFADLLTFPIRISLLESPMIFQNLKSPIVISATIFASAMLSLAQEAPKSAPRPLIANGDFSRFSTVQNLWDGIDSSGFLAVPPAQLPLLREDGSVGDTPVPPSVAVGDLNGDGLLDLLVASPLGYVYAYFNSGTAKEPKFTSAELVPLFLGLPDTAEETMIDWTDRYDENRHNVYGQRISLAPVWAAGQFDLIAGNYSGGVYYLRNTGTGRVPAFAQPRNLSETKVQLLSGGRVWANLVAPVAHDITGDGNLDLLIGDGSYSANSVHLFENRGTSSSPKFSEEFRHYLVYGEGREQLAPAVVDWNGDGLPDILVGDRRGELSIHLHPGQAWKPGEVFPLTSLVTLGSSSRLGSAITPAVGDMNGDGLFDILIGRINGRVSMALNSGTAGEPKFETPTDLLGEDTGLGRYKTPRGWSTGSQLRRGNAYGFISAVDVKDDPLADPQVGTHVLKAGYHPPGNTVFPPLNFRTADSRKSQESKDRKEWNNRTFIIETEGNIALVPGQRYTLRFKIRGTGVRNAAWQYLYRGRLVVEEGRAVTGDRGDVKRVGEEIANEVHEPTGTINVSGDWTEFTATLSPQFKDRRLSELKTVTNSRLLLRFELPDPTSVVYIDDVQIVPN